MGLESDIGRIEAELRVLFEKKKFMGIAQFVLGNAEEAVKLTEKAMSAKAIVELKFKFKTGWHCSRSESERHYEVMQMLQKKRYGFEKELLEARHPRRVEKLWKNAKQMLEQMYGMEFESREDVARMNLLFEQRQDLIQSVEELKTAISKQKIIEDGVQAEPGIGWEEVLELWKEHDFEPAVGSSAARLVNSVKDVVMPLKFSRQDLLPGDSEEIGLFNLLNFLPKHSTEFLNRRHAHPLSYYSKLLFQWKAGKLSFNHAFDLVFGWHAEKAGIKIDRIREWDGLVPKIMEDVAFDTLKKSYQNREQDEECRKFLQWLSQILLKRWEATAVDHERLFSYHVPAKWDKELIALFYQVREGKRYLENFDDLVTVERLPGVLKSMAEDGVISTEDIKPRLKEKYLKPDQVLTKEPRLLTQNQNEFVLSMAKVQKPAVISTEGTQRKMLPAVGENLPVPAKSLEKIFDCTKEHYVLFKGNHTLWIADRAYWPVGSPMLNRVYRLTLLNDSAEPNEGHVVQMAGHRFNVRELARDEKMRKLEDAVFDANIDFTSIKSLTVLLDISAEEFRQKYFKDFMAHVLAYDSELNAAEIQKKFENVENLSTAGVRLNLGVSGREIFKTFELAGRFGFNITYHGDTCIDWAGVPFIAGMLMNYLEEVGLAYRKEAEIDEGGRAIINQKLKDREFQQENLDAVISAVKAKGLANILSSIESGVRNHKVIDGWHIIDYDFRWQVDWEPCSHCGRRYIYGSIWRYGKEQEYEGVKAKDLHDLAYHPETFVNKLGNLRKICRLLSEVKDAETPVFISMPEIMPEMKAFVEAYHSYLETGRMMDVQTYPFEEEEIEDDPKLKAYIEHDRALGKKVNELDLQVDAAAEVLKKKYELMRGIKTDRKFWQDQRSYFLIYQTCSPELLSDAH
jgi:hypothetical protein